MTTLTLKPTHKAVLSYYSQLHDFKGMKVANEGGLAPLFAELLKHCARQCGWNLVEQYPMKRNGKNIFADGALIDKYNLPHGIWEAKDSKDDLEREVKKKFEAGYPSENILFQAPEAIIIVQNGLEVFNDRITNPQFLIRALKIFFEDYQPKEFLQWEKAAEEFKDRVPEIGRSLLKQIETERGGNKRFIAAFNDFYSLCRETINPELSLQAVEEMLIQHILTERIFRNVFKNSEFVSRNIIAREIEKVVTALTSQHFSRDEFLSDLDLFYKAIEITAETITDYSQKQHFLNTIYEKFFQGFSVKVADTHGIVYTPQPIVDFMVRSVEEILKKEFGKSLSDEGVHILDPFVGTGNFIIRVMREIKRHKLLYKYETELHCNEVMLLPYYIASMNIEHAYFELTGAYLPFEGICLVDTFEIAEEGGQESWKNMLFSAENTERVRRQKNSPIFVVIGNPPYNSGQVNENDNNKNRKYSFIDRRVKNTYAADSKATNKNALSDAYVKSFRFACDRIEKTGEGIVAFVSNNSYIDNFAFDGMRKSLHREFDRIYIVDLKGNVRKDSMKDGIPLGEKHTVFGLSAMVGISIAFLIKSKNPRSHKIFYSSLDFRSTRAEKFEWLEKAITIDGLKQEEIIPDAKNTWLTAEMADDFEGLLALGTKDAKLSRQSGADSNSCFKLFSAGLKTNRDTWVYNFNKNFLLKNINEIINNYNTTVAKWVSLTQKPQIDNFVSNNDSEISWSEGLKNYLMREILIEFEANELRVSLYRPFSKQYLYFDQRLNERQYILPKICPVIQSEVDNKIICVSAIGNTRPFHCLMTNVIPDLHLTGDSQCFPFYTYSEDGANRRENITDWSLTEFRSHYSDKKISKWDIFYYIYAILHHPLYRSKYAANLRRSLPRIPYAPNFKGFATLGKKLADLHVNYEDQPAYELEFMENPKSKLDWRVEKMHLSKDKTQIVYNDFLTLSGIPSEAFEYRLGNRSALDWIIDQYQSSTDKRSGIVNDPNNPDDPEYIVKLIGKVITVSLETVKIVQGLPKLEG